MNESTMRIVPGPGDSPKLRTKVANRYASPMGDSMREALELRAERELLHLVLRGLDLPELGRFTAAVLDEDRRSPRLDETERARMLDRRDAIQAGMTLLGRHNGEDR